MLFLTAFFEKVLRWHFYVLTLVMTGIKIGDALVKSLALRIILMCSGGCAFFLAPPAQAERILYTFSGAIAGPINSTQTFSMTTDGFITSNLWVSILDSTSCINCGTGPQFIANLPVSVLPTIPHGQGIEFAGVVDWPFISDILYVFDANSFASFGIHNSYQPIVFGLTGIGTLTVAAASAVPEPSFGVLILLGVILLGYFHRWDSGKCRNLPDPSLESPWGKPVFGGDSRSTYRFLTLSRVAKGGISNALCSCAPSPKTPTSLNQLAKTVVTIADRTRSVARGSANGDQPVRESDYPGCLWSPPTEIMTRAIVVSLCISENRVSRLTFQSPS